MELPKIGEMVMVASTVYVASRCLDGCNGCTGCAGDGDARICDLLPTCLVPLTVDVKGIIWKKQ